MAKIQYMAGSVFGGRPDSVGSWGRTAAELKPQDPLWLAQATAGTIAGAAGTRRAAIEAASQLTASGVGAAGSVMNQGTAGFSAVAAQSAASQGAITAQGMEADARRKASQRPAGSMLLGLGLLGADALIPNKSDPLPQRRTVEKPSYLTFGDETPPKAA